MEHLHDAAYLDTPMGMSVLGTPETVSALTEDDLRAFAAANMTGPRTVVTAAGNVESTAFAAMVSEAFSGIPQLGGDTVDASMAPGTFCGSDKRIRIDSNDACHVAVAFEGASHASEHLMPLMVMETLLGAVDESNLTLDTKNHTRRLAHDQGEQEAASSFKTFNMSYKDSGLFGVYFKAPDNRSDDAMWYTLWNMVRLCHKTTDAEVSFAKTQLKSQLMAQLGTNAGVSSNLAKSLMCFGRPHSIGEMFARIDAVDANMIKHTAKEIINDQDHALAAVGPIFELPDYTWIRRRSHWLRY